MLLFDLSLLLIIFLVGFVALAILGGGRYSLDAAWRRKPRAASR